MSKIEQIQDGDSGLLASTKINEAIKTVEVDATLAGTGEDASPLSRAELTGAITSPSGDNNTSLGSFSTAELNAALSDNSVAVGGGFASGSNTGDQDISDLVTGQPNGVASNSIPVFDGAGGLDIKESSALISDLGDLSVAGDLEASGDLSVVGKIDCDGIVNVIGAVSSSDALISIKSNDGSALVSALHIFGSSPTAHAIISARSTSGGDPKYLMSNPNQYFVFGIDTSDSDIFKMAWGQDVGSNNIVTVDPADNIFKLDQNNAVKIPTGTSAQRPASPELGMIRANSDTGMYEGYSGTRWEPLSGSYVAEYLVVGGGGGGGSRFGGGGGAGGYLSGSIYFQVGRSFLVTVGAGGSGGASTGGGGNEQASSGGNGEDSVFENFIAVGGGGGGAGDSLAGLEGGSGGGGAGRFAALGGQGTLSQGSSGGTSNGAINYLGGGGGGALLPGESGGSGLGSGGSGLAWVDSVERAGGGGGSHTLSVQPPGGLGGGGAGGSPSVPPVAGLDGTGGGGGGGAYLSLAGSAGNQPGADGGSGIVIIRYPGEPFGSGGTITESGGYTYHTFLSSGTFLA